VLSHFNEQSSCVLYVVKGQEQDASCGEEAADVKVPVVLVNPPNLYWEFVIIRLKPLKYRVQDLSEYAEARNNTKHSESLLTLLLS
jgi:hypothetical protein